MASRAVLPACAIKQRRNIQRRGRAGERQRQDPPVLGLSHNLGGVPNQNIAAVAMLWLEGA